MPIEGFWYFDTGGFDPEESGRIICYGIMSVSWVLKDDTWKPSIFLNAEFAVLNLQVIIYKSHQGRRQESHRKLRWNVRTFPWPMSANTAYFRWRRLSRDYCTSRTTRRVWEIRERGTNLWRNTWCGSNKYWKKKEVNLEEVCTRWYHIHCSLIQNLNCLKS